MAAAAGGFETAGKVITCKAAVVWKANEPLVLEDIQVEPPHAGEVRVKIQSTALCHSDVHCWGMEAVLPRILGHEAAGIVESVGEGVPDDISPGDHVLTLFTGECKKCKRCKSDKANICSVLGPDAFRGGMLQDGNTRFFKDGKPIYHFLGTSTFSEYTVLEYGCVVKVNPAAPLDKICLLSCGVSTGLGSVWNVAKVEPDSTVAIFGLGTLGLAVAEGARMAGASQIIGIDINPDKFKLAKDFGVTDTINSKEHDIPIQEVIQKMTEGGVDYSFECVGNVDLIRSAIECCHDGGGVCVIVGIVSSPKEFSCHSSKFLAGRVLKGSMLGGFKGVTQFPELVERYMRKEIQLDKFVTHELPFTRINEAFDLMLQGKSLRCVINVGGASS